MTNDQWPMTNDKHLPLENPQKKRMQSIDPITLQQKINIGEQILLIDVREPWEHEVFNIGGLLIPMNTVFANLDQIPTDKPVVIYCQKGIRSGLVIQRLQQKFQYNNLLNLAGGMVGWSRIFGQP
jgi:adenylyltransferase/sulfurtransferase